MVWDGRVRFGARWQITPLLLTFGGNRQLRPWRSFVAEPTARHSGSIEEYFALEVLSGSVASASDRWIVRGGLRSYVPILERGEHLSASVGGSVLAAVGKTGVGFDAGVHTFGGLLGVRVGATPTPGLRMTTITFELRFY